MPHGLRHHRIGVTLLLLAVLAAIFLKGFKEAIGLAVVIVAAYLALNAVLLVAAAGEVLRHPALLGSWKAALLTSHGSPLGMIAVSVLLFPRLALGLSGFETGVAVMPLVQRRERRRRRKRRAGRIRNTRRLLLTAALDHERASSSASSLVTTVLDAARRLRLPGGEANGRALAYLAHHLLGERFGTALRSQHDRHPLVRGGLRHGGVVEPRAPLPAAVRHGSRLGARDAAARAGLHGDRLRGDARLPRRAWTRRAAPTPPACCSS